ncbi:unnamed protein product [Schistocephalus solidus]|uniref:Uncharacterized protein n=1 Tax=Schistocephalus solidus TaxID=70667 RepID=A0A183SZ77_SCHSO|nr:unnamed protein product [Schistocephalus solidus]
MEISRRVLIDRGSGMTLQGNSEELPEATADQPGTLGGSRPEPTGLKDRGINLRSQPDRRRQGQKSGTKVTNAPDQHRQCPSPSYTSALLTHFPRANQSGRTS